MKRISQQAFNEYLATAEKLTISDTRTKTRTGLYFKFMVGLIGHTWFVGYAHDENAMIIEWVG